MEAGKTLGDYWVKQGTTSNEKVQWYFVAASGAKTKHIFKAQQKKEYCKQIGVTFRPVLGSPVPVPVPVYLEDKDYLPPQSDVFNYVNGEDVDYVTISIGGNDVYFAEVATRTILQNSYSPVSFYLPELIAELFGKGTPFKVTDSLDDMLDYLFSEDNVNQVKKNIKAVYQEIAENAPNAAIIVTGYPKLFNVDGNDSTINLQEATKINDSVNRFNGIIKGIIEDINKNGFDGEGGYRNIYFADVETVFDEDGGHGAYSGDDKAWIYPAIIGAQSEDLNDKAIASSYSVHPNKNGIDAYAKCVQETINNINSKTILGIVTTDGTETDKASVVEGAEVSIALFNSYSPDDIKHTVSNENGIYFFNDIPCGTHTITVTKYGYAPVTETVVVRSKDNRVIKDISIKKSQEKSRDIVLVLDNSGSMWGTPLNNTKAASCKFVDEILSQSSTTRIAVVTYSSYAETVSDFSNDAATLKTKINSITDMGMTNMYDGMSTAKMLLDNSTADKKAIVVMTDGEANKGVYGDSGNRTVTEGYDIYLSSYNAPIYDLAYDMTNNKGYTIYSFGFGLSTSSNSYDMMKHIASISPTTGERYFWANPNVDEIEFIFEDIQQTITTKKSIVIVIECPVTASVSLAGETLDDDHLTASFGSLKVTENGDNDRKYVFTVDDNPDYDIQINGTGDGEMTFTITYYEGDDAVYHKFVNVPLTAKTIVTTSPTDRSQEFEIFVDRNGDGKNDISAAAGLDDTVNMEGGITYVYKDTGKGTHFAKGSDGSYFEEEHHIENGICIECGAKEDHTRGHFHSDNPSAKPAPAPAPAPQPETTPFSDLPFVDVKTSDWFYDSVKYVYENGMMKGLSDTVFAPNVTLSRAMLVTILYRLEGSPAVSEANPFSDVAEGQWYTDAVIWANANGIVSGYGNGSFGPMDNITREQMAAILMRYAGYKGADTFARADLSGYADQDAVSSWALEAMQWANAEGLINGRTATTLAPAGETTRAEAAAILTRFCDSLQ